MRVALTAALDIIPMLGHRSWQQFQIETFDGHRPSISLAVLLTSLWWSFPTYDFFSGNDHALLGFRSLVKWSEFAGFSSDLKIWIQSYSNRPAQRRFSILKRLDFLSSGVQICFLKPELHHLTSHINLWRFSASLQHPIIFKQLFSLQLQSISEIRFLMDTRVGTGLGCRAERTAKVWWTIQYCVSVPFKRVLSLPKTVRNKVCHSETTPIPPLSWVHNIGHKVQ